MTKTDLAFKSAQRKPAVTGRLKVTHFGTMPLHGEYFLECAVLENGERGFIQRQMVKTLGFTDKTRGGRFERFCEKIGINPLNNNGKSEWPVFEVDMPGGGTAAWVPASMLTDVVKAGMVAYGQGKLTKQQAHIGQRCVELGTALIGVGLTALIDEATGYQYAREPDALQDLFGKLIRETASDWERRFQPDYYNAVCKIFGFQYGNRHRALPSIVGQITLRYVYMAVFPKEILAEIKSRRKSERLHQWLTDDGGMKLLERQINDVTAIARTSVDYKDFEARCAQAFYKPGQQLSMIYPQERAA